MQDSKNMLTTKELSLIEDLICLEELASKKAKLYSRITTNQKLEGEMKNLFDRHFKRVEALLSLL